MDGSGTINLNIIDRFDAYLTKPYERKRRSHHPSDVTACLRQLAYKWKNVPEIDPPTAGNIIKMNFGNKAEELLVPWLEWEVKQGSFESFEQQTEITGVEDELEYIIHGYQDFVLTKNDGQKVGIECKSSFGRGIVGIQKTGEPKPEHLMQIYLYLYYGECDYYYLVYIGRDNGYRCQFLIEKADGGITYDKKFMPIDHTALIARLKAAELSIGEEVLPDREYKAAIRNGEIVDKFVRDKVEYKQDWQCGYCGHRSICWAEQLKGGVFYGEERIE